MPNDPIKNEILNIMSGKRKFVPQQKVSKTHALNEDILNLIASKKQTVSKDNVPRVDYNLLGDLNNILKPKTQNKNLFGLSYKVPYATSLLNARISIEK